MTGSTKQRVLGAVCVLVVCGLLVVGLWPFHAPKNKVSWLGNGNGVLFGDYGSAVTAAAFKANGSKADTPCSLEIWLEPSLVDYSGTILAFYRPENAIVPFQLRQSLGDLELQRALPDPLHHARRMRIYVDDLFIRPKPIFVAISSGPGGAAVYADGSLVKKYPSFELSSRDFTRQLIVGNAPATTDNWSGRLKGLAIYDHELTAGEASQHYASWMSGRQTDLVKSQGAVALYFFNENSGNVVHNQVDSATDLLILERFFVLRERFLEPFWEEFSGGWSYWENFGINIAGFIPFGFFLRAYFSAISIKRATWPTIALGFAVSLTIEVLQAFLPTRDSGMTDLVTNTLGTSFGAMIYTNSWVKVVLGGAALFTRRLTADASGETKVSRLRAVHQSIKEVV